MSEQERNSQVEMLMRRVVTAESALRTIMSHTWDRDQTLTIAKRAIQYCESEVAKHLKSYPDR